MAQFEFTRMNMALFEIDVFRLRRGYSCEANFILVALRDRTEQIRKDPFGRGHKAQNQLHMALAGKPREYQKA